MDAELSTPWWRRRRHGAPQGKNLSIAPDCAAIANFESNGKRIRSKIDQNCKVKVEHQSEVKGDQTKEIAEQKLVQKPKGKRGRPKKLTEPGFRMVLN